MRAVRQKIASIGWGIPGILPTFLLAVLAGIGAVPGLAQDFNPTFREYTEKEGLPSSHVFCTFQDSEHYIWVATQSGVARYDGSLFQNFTLNEGLTDNSVFSIYEDRKGRIWFLTYSGVPCFFHSGRMHNPGNTPFLGRLSFESYLASFLEDDRGNIFLGGKDGKLYRVGPDNEVTLILDSKAHSIYHQYRNALGQHCLLLDHLTLGIPRGEGFTSCQFLPRTKPKGSPRAGAAAGQDLLVATGNELYQVGSGGEVTPIPEDVHQIHEGIVLAVCTMGPEEIWVATSQGAYRLRLKAGRVVHSARYFAGLPIHAVMRDHEGGLWFSTPQGVLYCPILEIATNRTPFSGPRRKVSTLGTRMVGNVTQVFAGYENGTVTQVQTVDRTEEPLFQMLGTVSSSHRITQISPDPVDGSLVVNGHGGIARFSQGRLHSCIAFAVHQIASSPDQPDCLCHYGGYDLTDLSRCGGSGTVISPREIADAQRNSRCHAAAYGPWGKLWVAEINRLFIVAAKKIHRIDFREIVGNAFRISVMRPSHDAMWIGTVGAGLFRFDGHRLTHYSLAHGVPSRIISSLYIDPESRVWVGTDQGLAVGDAHAPGAAPHFKNIPESSSIPGQNINAIAASGDELFIATDMGLTILPQNINLHPIRPEIRLREVRLDETTLPLPASQIEVPPQKNNLQISYRGIVYRGQQQLEYSYRLRENDSAWQKTQNTSVEFPALPPGKYTFEVRSRDPNGGAFSEAATLGITVIAPYWKRTGFILGVIWLIAILFGAILYATLRSHRRRLELINRSLTAEQKLLQAQMNPHFIFNSLNSIQQLFLENKKEVANDYLADFSSMVRLILEHVRTTRISLAQELRFVRLYLRMEKLRLSDRFDIDIRVQPGMATGKLAVPPMLIQPFLENAIWHGIAPLKDRRGRVTLDLRQNEKQLICEIRDNGIGREQSTASKISRGKQHKSLAMQISRDRLQALDSRTQLEVRDGTTADGRRQGTVVILKIPTQKL
ncbi:MAG: two-component regulator propeller domain-containing protein [Bacteroidota bacterium]